MGICCFSPAASLAVPVVHGSNNANLLSCGLCGQGIVPHSELQSYSNRISLTGQRHSIQHPGHRQYLKDLFHNNILFGTAIPSSIPRRIITPGPNIYFPAIRLSCVPFSTSALRLGVVFSSITRHLYPLVVSPYKHPRKDLGGGSSIYAVTTAPPRD